MNAPALTFRPSDATARPARLSIAPPPPHCDCAFPSALEPMSDDEVNDIACRSEVAREMRLAAHGAHPVFAGALNCAADALTSNNNHAVRVMLDVLPLHCTARRVFVAFVEALVARDWTTVTEALDAWERSGEMEPALWVLTVLTGETGKGEVVS